MAADAISFIDGLGLRSVDILGHSIGRRDRPADLPAPPRPGPQARPAGTGPRGGDAAARQAPGVAPLFTRRDDLGEDKWLPIMFSPSKEGQAADRAFIAHSCATPATRAGSVMSMPIGVTPGSVTAAGLSAAP